MGAHGYLKARYKAMIIGNNFEEFAAIVGDAMCKTMNENDIGEELTNKLLELKLEENPNLTVEEWEKCKNDFVLFLFTQLMEHDKNFMESCATHIYNELREELR